MPDDETPATRVLDRGREIYDSLYSSLQSRYDWDLLARRISDVVSPVFLAILTWIPLAGQFSPNAGVAALNVLLAIVFFFFVPLLVPYIYVKRGMDTIHVARRELRWLPMLVAIAGYLAFFALEAYVLRVDELARLLLLFMASAAPFVLITLFWKISVHMSGNAIAIVTLAHYYPYAWVLALVHLPVAWARIRLKAHTPMQVVAGLAYGTAFALAWFRYERLLPI